MIPIQLKLSKQVPVFPVLLQMSGFPWPIKPNFKQFYIFSKEYILWIFQTATCQIHILQTELLLTIIFEDP